MRCPKIKEMMLKIAISFLRSHAKVRCCAVSTKFRSLRNLVDSLLGPPTGTYPGRARRLPVFFIVLMKDEEPSKTYFCVVDVTLLSESHDQRYFKSHRPGFETIAVAHFSATLTSTTVKGYWSDDKLQFG